MVDVVFAGSVPERQYAPVHRVTTLRMMSPSHRNHTTQRRNRKGANVSASGAFPSRNPAAISLFALRGLLLMLYNRPSRFQMKQEKNG